MLFLIQPDGDELLTIILRLKIQQIKMANIFGKLNITRFLFFCESLTKLNLK